MEENTNINVILKEKMDSYSFSKENLVAPSEITVTITLSEYRELVRKSAIMDNAIDKIRLEKFEAEKIAETLKKENAALKMELYEKSKDKVEGKEEKEKEEGAK